MTRPGRFVPTALLLAVFALAACDSAPAIGGPCEPAAPPVAPSPSGASVAVADAAGCSVMEGGAGAGPAEYLFGPERDYERRPTFLISVRGPTEDGPHVRLGIDGAAPPAPGRYPVMDLRGADGRFGVLPARFDPDSTYSITSNGTGRGYWFATGGELVVERSDSTGVSGTVEATYLHGGGGRPLTVRARFYADLVDANSYGQYSNPHGG